MKQYTFRHLPSKISIALAGNRTPVSRVAVENSTTEPPKPPQYLH